jgi:hypothetical protein
MTWRAMSVSPYTEGEKTKSKGIGIKRFLGLKK